jgi:hypothetical protein
MGAKIAKPKPSVPSQIVGADLSHTGRFSFNTALSTPLNSLTYHGSTQIILDPSTVILSRLKMIAHWPSLNPSNKPIVQRISELQLDSYVSATDVTSNSLVENSRSESCLHNSRSTALDEEPGHDYQRANDVVVRRYILPLARLGTFPQINQRSKQDVAALLWV